MDSKLLRTFRHAQGIQPVLFDSGDKTISEFIDVYFDATKKVNALLATAWQVVGVIPVAPRTPRRDAAL